MKISEAIVRSTKNRKLCNIFLGCTVTIKHNVIKFAHKTLNHL